MVVWCGARGTENGRTHVVLVQKNEKDRRAIITTLCPRQRIPLCFTWSLTKHSCDNAQMSGKREKHDDGGNYAVGTCLHFCH